MALCNLAFSPPLRIVSFLHVLHGAIPIGLKKNPNQYSRPSTTPQATSKWPTMPKLPHLPLSVENALLINAVPFLWGTYGPAAKLLQSLTPAISPSLLNLATFLAALLTITPLTYIDDNDSSTSRAPGIELGTYLYFGTCLQVLGLNVTSASRAAFLVQLSTVFVPVMEVLIGRHVPVHVFFTSGIAILGTCILALEANTTSALSANVIAAFNMGDVLSIAAAILYSLYVVRLEVLSDRVGRALSLVKVKIQTQVALSALTAAALYAVGDVDSMSYISALPLSWNDGLLTVACIAWIGAGSTALANWFQVVGQRRVGPSQAAVGYASQPIWAVLIAVALRVDRLGWTEVVGGGLIVAAGSLLAVLDRREKNRK